MILDRDGGEARTLVRQRLGRLIASVALPERSPDQSAILTACTVSSAASIAVVDPHRARRGPDHTDTGMRRLLSSLARQTARGSLFISIGDRNGDTCGSDECSYNGELNVMDGDDANPGAPHAQRGRTAQGLVAGRRSDRVQQQRELPERLRNRDLFDRARRALSDVAHSGSANSTTSCGWRPAALRLGRVVCGCARCRRDRLGPSRRCTRALGSTPGRAERVASCSLRATDRRAASTSPLFKVTSRWSRLHLDGPCIADGCLSPVHHDRFWEATARPARMSRLVASVSADALLGGESPRLLGPSLERRTALRGVVSPADLEAGSL